MLFEVLKYFGVCVWEEVVVIACVCNAIFSGSALVFMLSLFAGLLSQ